MKEQIMIIELGRVSAETKGTVNQPFAEQALAPCNLTRETIGVGC
jgi:hypothetical protein